MDSFLEIKDPLHFLFYLFSVVILVHWWLIYKSVDDAFGEEVANSGLDLIIGIIQIIFIEYIALTSRDFSYLQTTWFVVCLLASDLLWTAIWRFVGRWHTHHPSKVKVMESELKNNFLTTIPVLIIFLLLIVCHSLLSNQIYVFCYIASYILFIVLTLKLKIIDVSLF